jgi:shikimate kinase
VGVLIFIAGGVLGAGISLRFLRDRVLYVLHHPQEVPARLSLELKGRLGLNAEETEKVRQIIARRQLALQKIRREVQPQVEEELDELRKEISDALTPEQSAKWNAWFEQMRATWLPPAPPPPTEEKP